MRNQITSSDFSASLALATANAMQSISQPSYATGSEDDWAIAYWLTACASKSAQTARAYRMQATRFRAFVAALTGDLNGSRLLLDATYEHAGAFVQWLSGVGDPLPREVLEKFGLKSPRAERPKISGVVARQAVVILHGMYAELAGALLPGHTELAVKVNPFAPYRRGFNKVTASRANSSGPDAHGVGKALSKEAWAAMWDIAQEENFRHDSTKYLLARRDRLILVCLMLTWERRSAVAGIVWSDLKLTRDGYYSVRRVRKGKGPVWASVPRQIAVELMAWRRLVKLPAEATIDELHRSIFWMGGKTAGHDGPISDQTVYRAVKSLMLAAAAKMKAQGNITAEMELSRAGNGPHTVRHTMATMYLEAGGEDRIAQGMLDHASIATTTGLYDNKSQKNQAQAMQALWVDLTQSHEKSDS